MSFLRETADDLRTTSRGWRGLGLICSTGISP